MAEEAPTFPENKWTTADKLVQLRNVMKLQDRASKQAKVSALVLCKKQSKHIKDLLKENAAFREKLDTNLRGDDLRRRTTMRNNRPYQLAYQRRPTDKIVENIEQILFNKTKELDKLRYERREIENTLITLKLQLQEMKFANKFVHKLWKEQELANKVQNVLVKQNAARTVKETYEKMLKILRNDSQQFDHTLERLKSDRIIQSKCILRAAEMGQIATEELANLRDEYKVEEKNILSLMKRMDKTAKNLKSELERVTASCRTVVRTESITRFGSIQVDEDDEPNDSSVIETILLKDMADLEDQLNKLQEVTEVLSFDEIYPRIVQQVEQRVRLLRQLQQKDSLRKHLLDQRNQLETLLESLEHTMVSTTEWYKFEKARITAETQKTDIDDMAAQKAIEDTGKIVLCIRMGLMSLSRKLDRIEKGSTFEMMTSQLDNLTPAGVLETLPGPETDALDILENVNRKMLMLINQIKTIGFHLNRENYIKGKRAFEMKIMHKNIIEFKEDEYELAMTEMLEELGTIEDPLVPTRADIKNQSARVVEIFGTDDFGEDPKAKRAKKK